MSIGALLKGVEKRLRSEEVLNDRPSEEIGAVVGVQPGTGKPPNNFGQYYISIRYGGGRGEARNPNLCHDVYQGVILTITYRMNYAPRDRQAKQMTGPGALDFYSLADYLAGPEIVHGQPLVLQYANEFIVGTQEWADLQNPVRDATVNGFYELLVLNSVGVERPADPAWVGTDKPTKDVYVTDIRFAEARRTQVNSSG